MPRKNLHSENKKDVKLCSVRLLLQLEKINKFVDEDEQRVQRVEKVDFTRDSVKLTQQMYAIFLSGDTNCLNKDLRAIEYNYSDVKTQGEK